jgi:hypothetical protein
MVIPLVMHILGHYELDTGSVRKQGSLPYIIPTDKTTSLAHLERINDIVSWQFTRRQDNNTLGTFSSFFPFHIRLMGFPEVTPESYSLGCCPRYVGGRLVEGVVNSREYLHAYRRYLVGELELRDI